MKNSILIPSIIALSFLVCFIQTYPTGAPKCSSKVPKHESHKPQTGESPYTLTAKKNGKTATVGISGGSFKGFFIYAVQPGSSDMIGTFQTSDKVKELSCGSAVSSYSSFSSNFIHLIDFIQNFLLYSIVCSYAR